MKKRNIGLMILYTILTLGIYIIVWSCLVQGQLKEKTKLGFKPVGHLLMCLFTFGIYLIYWQYAAGTRIAKLGAENRAIVYLILCFVGFAWLNPFLMQSQINKLR